MRIVELTDIHGGGKSFDTLASELKAADVVVVSGDLTNFGDTAACALVLDGIRTRARRVLAVGGNIDPSDWDEHLTRVGVGIHGRHVIIDGIAFVGLSGYPSSEQERQQYLDKASAGIAPGTPVILVSHRPPHDTKVDLAGNGDHAGSRVVRAFIEQLQPLICFTGHIHEAAGVDMIDRTYVVNPGLWQKGRYAVADIQGNSVTVELRVVN